MNNLFDYLKFKGQSFAELEQVQKDLFNKFVEVLREHGIEKTILSYPTTYQFNIEEPYNFDSSFPKDLTQSMMAIWLNLEK